VGSITALGLCVGNIVKEEDSVGYIEGVSVLRGVGLKVSVNPLDGAADGWEKGDFVGLPVSISKIVGALEGIRVVGLRVGCALEGSFVANSEGEFELLDFVGAMLTVLFCDFT
jgi:hypothetical protein